MALSEFHFNSKHLWTVWLFPTAVFDWMCDIRNVEAIASPFILKFFCSFPCVTDSAINANIKPPIFMAANIKRIRIQLLELDYNKKKYSRKETFDGNANLNRWLGKAQLNGQFTSSRPWHVILFVKFLLQSCQLLACKCSAVTANRWINMFIICIHCLFKLV